LKATAIGTVAGNIAFNDQNYAIIPVGTGQWRQDAQSHRWIKDTVFSDAAGITRSGSLRLYQGTER
jgi:hypothetical protein